MQEQQPIGGLTVADLIAIDALGLVVHAGRSALANAIEIAHVSESPTAPEWIDGGGFLMTSALTLTNTTEDWNRYVNTLSIRGAAALALGLGHDLPYQAVPQRLVEAAETRGLPLLEIPSGTPFMLVTKAIVDGRANLDRRLLEESFTLQRELTTVAAREGGLTGLIQAWHVATGESVMVLDRRGRRLAGSPDFPPAVAAAVSAAVPNIPLLIEDFVPVPTEAGTAVVSAVGAIRHAGYLARLGGAFELGSRAVPTLLSLLALEFERRWLVDEPARRTRANQLTRLLGTEDEARAEAQLRALGVHAKNIQAVAIRAESDAHAEEVLADITIALGTNLVRRRERIVEALTVNDPKDALAALEVAGAVGIGAPSAPGLAGRSLRQAQSALATSVRTGGIVEYVDGRCHDFLLNVADPAYLHSFADAVLAPLDRDGNGQTLIETLHAWLAEGRSVEGCSERLGVHRHTVRNRIQRVTQLLGRGVESVDAQTELWLALKARGLRDESL